MRIIYTNTDFYDYLRRLEIYNIMETKGDLTYARIRIYN